MIKSQGIKTKLVPFILSSIRWDGGGRWVEPFVGSGAVLFNAAPERALAADANGHLIAIHLGIQSGSINPESTRRHLEREGRLLQQKGDEHYYHVRDRFNRDGDPLDFIFLNRGCFNGIIRFNSRGGFNVPFCRKPGRFSRAYISKICNQVTWMADVMRGRDWRFVVQDWRETLSEAGDGDFVYLDPPYVGRHTDYFSAWSDEEASALAEAVKRLGAGFAYSMWKQNRYRVNDHLLEHFRGFPVLTYRHFYHVGSTEALRNAMDEALVVSPKSLAEPHLPEQHSPTPESSLF